MVATRAQRSAAAARRALQVDDVLTGVLLQLDVHDGCLRSVASVSKAWRSAWRRRCAGQYRLLRTGIGAFRHTSHVTALANGGAIVPDYGHFHLEEFSPDGDSQTIYCEQIETPGAMALLGDGTAWVLSRDYGVISRLRYTEGVGAEPPLNRWPRSLPRDSYDDSDEDDEYVPGDDLGRISVLVDINALRLRPHGWELHPHDLAVSGDRLLVLCGGRWNRRYARICVFDSQTGAFLYQIGRGFDAGEADALNGPKALVTHQDLCFVADTYNHAIKIYNFRQRELVRTMGSTAASPYEQNVWEDYHAYEDPRRSDLPCEFNEPVGVAFLDGRLYVSEWGGRRIQILRFASGIHGPVECLQIIPSPYGTPLAGLCVSGERLWCLGQARGGSDSMMPSTDGCLHLFTACV